ncbi:hypothetical protein AgCh_008247 [Apium graveolens]
MYDLLDDRNTYSVNLWRLDNDGNVWLIRRANGRIKSGGDNVYDEEDNNSKQSTDNAVENYAEVVLSEDPFVVDRSQGCATTIVLPRCISTEDLIFVSDKCPSLKVVAVFDTYDGDVGCAISDLLAKWKKLEVLKLDGCLNLDLVLIIDEIGLNCKNFVELCVINTDINQSAASAIVSNLSTIKRLVLDRTNLEKVNLVLILRGCKELELLYVRDCVGFDKDDGEILMFASEIKDFRCDGSTAEI